MMLSDVRCIKTNSVLPIYPKLLLVGTYSSYIAHFLTTMTFMYGVSQQFLVLFG